MIKNIIKNIYKKIAKYIRINLNIKYKTVIDGMHLEFYDSISSRIVKSVTNDIEKKDYSDLKSLKFSPGDVIIDIGANVGIVSIFLAKKYPFLKIYAFEPVLENYKNFIKNIKLNKIPAGTIILENKAITKDGRDVTMNINLTNSGGSALSNIIARGYYRAEKKLIKSISITDIINKYNLQTIKMLKIDCEGSEYEILYNTPVEILQKIQILRGEFHENKNISNEYDAKELKDFVKNNIKNANIKISKDCFFM